MSEDMPFPEVEENEGQVELDPRTDIISFFGEKITKKAISAKAEAISNKLLSGDSDPLDVYLKAKVVSDYLLEVMKKLKDAAIEEASKYKVGENFKYGIQFEGTYTASKYDYSHDKEWSELDDKEGGIKEKKKEREELMKKAGSFAGAADDDGVAVPAAKSVGGGKPTIKVTVPPS